jgi:rSAM/selenodomain-associated transferase 2
MNAGADAATGEMFIFLHADTRLPLRFDRRVREALSLPTVAGGAFALRLDQKGGRFRLIESMANLRSRWGQMPYGDQAIFITRKIFYETGGFREQPIMEDVELVRRLRKKGKITILPAPVVSSARRWLSRGAFKTTVIHQLLLAAYLLGVSPARLARWRD